MLGGLFCHRHALRHQFNIRKVQLEHGSVIIDSVCDRHTDHRIPVCLLGCLPGKSYLYTLRPGDFPTGPWQKDPRDGYSERLPRGQGVAERQRAGLTADGLIEQRRIGKAHGDIARHGGDWRISALDLTVRADRLDAIKVVLIGELGADDVADVHTVGLYRSVEMTKTLERQCRGRADLR